MKNEKNNSMISRNNEGNFVSTESNEILSMSATVNTQKPSFGITDYWNVQKMRRDRVYRRYM